MSINKEAIPSIGELFTDEILMKNDLAYFAEKMLGMEIADHHKEWAKLIRKHKKIGINAPRDHGKSFMFSFAYVIWRAYYNWLPRNLMDMESFKSVPRISIGYIFSNTVDQAVLLLDLVKQEIESNEKLSHLLPATREVWSKTQIRLKNGAQIRARGWGQAVRGAHPVWIVCDDVLKDDIIYSEVQRKKYNDYFFSAVTPMLVPGGQMVVVGTPMHQDDLYHHIKASGAYEFKKFAAISEGKALWPTRYTRQMLEQRKREVGSLRFAREYLCEPMTEDTALFTTRMIEGCFDYEYELPRELDEEMKANLRIYTGVDLAMSANVGADYTVIITLGVDKFGNRFLLDMRRKRGLPFTEQLKEIQDVYRTFRPMKIKIESNGFQSIFQQTLVTQTDMPVEAHITTGRNKNSLEIGVPAMVIQFENRKFVIPRKTKRDIEKLEPLINELRAFTYVDGKLQGLGTHDDTVMALWIANSCCDETVFDFKLVGD